MSQTEFLAERFEQNRDHLRAVAYRMLGSFTEAEDAVQEAWLRLSRTDDSSIDNLGGWLTTVVARVCLDMLRARNSRREDELDEPSLPAAHIASPNPEQEALLANSVGIALLIVLDRLAPAERLAFVLHDMFDLSFEEISSIIGRSPVAARQLASRARKRVRGESAPKPAISAKKEWSTRSSPLFEPEISTPLCPSSIPTCLSAPTHLPPPLPCPQKFVAQSSGLVTPSRPRTAPEPRTSHLLTANPASSSLPVGASSASSASTSQMQGSLKLTSSAIGHSSIPLTSQFSNVSNNLSCNIICFEVHSYFGCRLSCLPPGIAVRCFPELDHGLQSFKSFSALLPRSVAQTWVLLCSQGVRVVACVTLIAF